ncbi:DUF5658 family protein [sulfur-oxidizing endosymbiont of Gigantopelta aegis]|uniref:DUF5658 family protein n=1 Tax=sulfur-oxidizing endosymbiont of Gigantopelta aegis TaxID=2794934 RepID=UPI003CCCDB9F
MNIFILLIFFVFLNFIDLFFTIKIVSAGGHESNPFIRVFINRWGYSGLLVFKLLFIIFVGWMVFSQYFMELELIAANIVYICGLFFLYKEYKKITAE